MSLANTTMLDDELLAAEAGGFTEEFLLSFDAAGFVTDSRFGLTDYQQFAAEDEGRTEEPTERKKREEKEKGRTPKTAELPSALILLMSFIVLFFTGDWILAGMAKALKFFMGEFTQIQMPAGPSDLGSLLNGLTWEVGKLIIPIFATVVIFGIVGNVIQVGFMFSWKPMELKAEKIKPNFKKVLFSLQTVMNLAKSILKVFFIGWVAYFVISDDFLLILQTTSMSLGGSLQLISWAAFKLIIIVAVILLILAIPDYIYQRYEFIESIKMTRQDLKQEFRETEGDAYIKQRQKERAREITRQNMLGEVPGATVVITNPTHYAVALRYEAGQDNEPIVVAKGVDSMAQRIKEIAREHDVEIRENAPLARALFASVEVGEPIPQQFYEIVIGVFKTLKKFRTMAGMSAAG